MEEFKTKNFFQSLKYAFCGFGHLIIKERNIKIYFGIFFSFLIIDIIFKVSLLEIMISMCITFAAIALEAVNTAIEMVVDKIIPQKDDTAKNIKDYSAAGVLAFGIAFMIFQSFSLISRLISALA